MGDKKPPPQCCIMDCDKEADFEIYGESKHPDDATEACEDHVGALLGSPAWLKNQNQSWTVVFLGVLVAAK